jgi:thiol-disulfide isomerase/thioredoxin
MKNLKFLLALPGMLAIQSVLAQTDVHLKLSDQYPSGGQKIALTHEPSGTVVDGKKDISAVVYYLDNKDTPVADVDLRPDGKSWRGDLFIPATAKAFFIKISADNQVDNNNDQGYVYLVYKDKQPVPGAYALKAYLLASGMGNYLAKIKVDNNEGMALYKKEFTLHPQSKKDYAANYYMMVANKPEYKAEIDQEITALAESNNEKDMRVALNLLRSTKQMKQFDSLARVIKTKFSNGTLVKDDLLTSIYQQKDMHKKDSLFNIYAEKYPENPSDKSTSLDNLRATIAWGYLKKADVDSYHKYESQIRDKSVLAGYLNDVAWNWAVAGEHLADAEKLARQSVDILAAKINNPVGSPYTSPNQAKKNARGSYIASADTYAYVLWKENKSAEALPYMKDVYDQTSDEENSSEHYALILAGVGQYDKALDVISKSMKAGQSSDVLKEELKKDYIKVKGNDSGYDQYLASLDKVSMEKVRADLAKTIINQPAPVFALKDLDGKIVSLSELKGKVVIVDFWATWCGPCKASFPGMQMAVNKYKDDPNVKFLFVDTWEREDNYLDGVKKFIADNKYIFHVLIDEKGDDGRQSKVVNNYKVEGIPTKFIIDKNGNIRFKYVGYSGTPEKLLDEVTNMVDMARNPETAGQKVSVSK